MKFFLIHLTLVCCFAGLSVARQANFKGNTHVEPEATTDKSDITRLENELNKLYEVAKEKIRNKVNVNANTADIVRNLIETNATGLLHGYPASCPAVSQSHGVNMVQVADLQPFPVFCDTRIAGAGWTVIQRRINGNINFYRNWTEYRRGFGNIAEEFFIGLDKLHAITATTEHELYILLEDFEGRQRHARYDNFLVQNRTARYNLTSLGKYSGNAGDSLTAHLNSKFSTYDVNNVLSGSICAEQNMGAWWYRASGYCALSSLNGLYLVGDLSLGHLEKGLYWDGWKGQRGSYKYVQMMVRPKCYLSYEKLQNFP